MGSTVSVIVPTHNRVHLLRLAIESVLNQTQIPQEIIVVDNCSTKSTAQYLKTLEPIVRVFTLSQLGRSKARNLGLYVARSDLITFLDDDDLLPRESIEKRAAFLSSNPDYDVVYSNALTVDIGGTIRGEFKRVNAHKPSGGVFEAIVVNNLAPIHAYMFRRSCLEKVSTFDESLESAEDWDFWIRMASHYRFGYLDDSLAYYRLHEAMSSRTKAFDLAFNGIIVQKRAFSIPAFQQLPALRKAQIYEIHATWNIRVNQLKEAKHYFYEAIRTAPHYWRPYCLLALLTIIELPLRYILRILIRSSLLDRLLGKIRHSFITVSGFRRWRRNQLK